MKLSHVFMLFAVLVLTACGGGIGSGESSTSGASTQDEAQKVSRDAGLFPLRIGDAEVRIQLALTEQEQRRGLMFRKDLPDGQGMIFPYKKAQRMHFWMNNVPIDLDIGFFDSNGVLKEVRHMYANDTRNVSSSGSDIQFALEMASGWYKRASVRPGDVMDMTMLAKAIKERGVQPSKYGISASH